jgi:prevent-host-death family protein
MGEPEVSIRDLRNHGGEVVDRVAAGERIIITRDGRPIAELRPLPRPSLARPVVRDRWSRLPEIDPNRLREDLDAVIDSSL